MKTFRQFYILILFFIVSSCAVQKKQVGNYNAENCKKELYAKDKDIYLFWNQVQVRDSEKNISIKDYEKTVKRSFMDGLVFYGTAGIVSFYSVKIEKCKEK